MEGYAFATLEPAVVLTRVHSPDQELSAARAEADAIRAAAREEGLADGRAEAALALAPVIIALQDTIADVSARAQTMAADFEADAVQLAFALAEKVVGAAVEADGGLLVEAVRGALRGIVDREQITVMVAPDDLEALRSAVGELRGELGGMEHVEVQADRRVERGGAVIHHVAGEVDARPSAKLERAREVVATALAERG